MRVYVAGPMGKGPYYTGEGLMHVVENFRRAFLLADILAERGHTPFIPHLGFYWEMATGAKSKAEWMELDLPWVDVCDGLMRLMGGSDGSDEEVYRAGQLSIPVVLVPYECSDNQRRLLVKKLEDLHESR